MPGYNRFKVETLAPRIGAIVHGIDLADSMDEELFEEVHSAWMDHQVLFFRDQVLTPSQHLDFASQFGDFHIHPAAPYAHDNPALMVIHTDENSRRNNGSGWHSDVSADEEPPLGSFLHLHHVPKHGGDTLFASMYAAYETLSPSIQDLLEGLEARHVSDYTNFYGDHQPQRAFPTATHPVVRTHPVTKKRALYVNAGFTKQILGLTPKESRSLLDFLFRHIENPVNQCRFHWEKNSLAMWDNRCVQHRALWDYFPETRSGLRVTICGDRPFFDADS